MEANSESFFSKLQSQSLALTSRMTDRWSAIQNSSTPRKAANRWEHTSMLASYLESAEVVGLGNASPACFTWRVATVDYAKGRFVIVTVVK
jgi:hypothetical protein